MAAVAHTPQRKIGALLLLVGVVSAIVALLAAAAGAAAETFNATGSVTVNTAANRTSVRFAFTGSREPSDIRVLPCARADIVSASGPPGTTSSSAGFGGSGQTGVKFQPGKFGTYTIVFSGRVWRADVVVVQSHQHTVIPLGNTTCAPAATTSTSVTAPPVTAPASTPTTAAASAAAPAPAAAAPAPQVLGNTVSKAAPVRTEVAGTTLARTGPRTRLLLLLAGVALTLGGLALVAGSPVRAQV